MLHVVKKGETLAGIARVYGTSVSRLRSDNGISAGQPLVPGQALVVVKPRETYTVQPGDTLYGIAGAVGLPLRQLLQYNPTLTWGPLYAGETLALELETQAERWGPITVNGYAYPHIRLETLRRALPFLTSLSVFSYGFREDGSLIAPADSWLLAQAAEFGVTPVLVLSSIDESGTFSASRAARLFQDENLQSAVLEALLQVMTEKGYWGLDADFEYIDPADRGAFLAFLTSARQRLHQRGFFLHVDLAPKSYAAQPGLLYESHDYAAVGAIADSVLLMTYEWGYAYGPPMAIAPLPQVESTLRYALTEMPAKRILLGLPNYGYDWNLPYEQGRRAITLGNQEAVRLAVQMGAEIRFDETAQAPGFTYTQDGSEHQVWFEDARSVLAKFSLIAREGLRGGGYWNLLRPFPQNWALLSQRVVTRVGEPAVFS